MKTACDITTDTATVAVFDPECLHHRLQDDADWWSDPTEELTEINAGNVLFASIRADGHYTISISDAAEAELSGAVTAVIRCTSGRVFVGAGELVPADGVAPDSKYGGAFIGIRPGAHRVTVSHPTPGQLHISIVPENGEPVNQFTESPKVEWPPTVELSAAEDSRASMEIRVGDDLWAQCPNCSRRFKTTDVHAYSDGKHQRCGRRLDLVFEN